MQLTSIRPGDIVEVDHKGRVFLATVTEKEKQQLTLNPITPNITWRHAKAREIRAHYKRMKNGRK